MNEQNLNSTFTELKYKFDEIFNMWLNETILKLQVSQERMMIVLINMMLNSLNESEVK